jgi:hypothetical protein
VPGGIAAFRYFDARRGPKGKPGAAQLTVGVNGGKSKLQKEYASGAAFKHRPVNGLRTSSRDIFPQKGRSHAKTSAAALCPALYFWMERRYRCLAFPSDKVKIELLKLPEIDRPARSRKNVL